ncbi:hypothetical protein [Burkholderia humptydooensis]|uniref:hypothetical protein n=1 Tax=Burkholderia humptydooensis TaxID=430531 RepID=UPI00041D52EE|nr:hypothetical protein [Burkholderia humptydooensis]
MLLISATASHRSMPSSFSRYFPDFRDCRDCRDCRVVSAIQADRRTSLLETIIFFRKRFQQRHIPGSSRPTPYNPSLFNASIGHFHRLDTCTETDHGFSNSFEFGTRRRLLPPCHQNKWY